MKKFLILFTGLISIIIFESCATKSEQSAVSIKELETVVSNVNIDRYSHLLGDVKEKKGNDGIYEVKLLCKTYCPASEKALNNFVKKFYKIYCVYGKGKPVSKEKIVKLPEEIKKGDDYWKYVIYKVKVLNFPDYYKNIYIQKAKRKELPILLPTSRIYQVYTPTNCYIKRRNLIFFVKPAYIDKNRYDLFINVNYIKTYEVIEAYAKKLADQIKGEIERQIEKDKKTVVWVSTQYDYVKDGLVLKHFLSKPELERISIEFTLENPTKDKKYFKLTDLMFERDNSQYPVVYLEENDGKIKGVSIKGGCRTVEKNKIEIKPYSNCEIQYGGKLWAKGVIIPGVVDLDNGILYISGYKIQLKKTTLYDLKASGVYWK